MAHDGERFWVLIESGSNQEFILQSTRRRFQVGASELVKDLARWVERAVAAEGGSVETVVCTSSKALLRVPDRDSGKRIVKATTAKALRLAPGLDVWGYVDNEATSDDDAMGRLPEVYRQHTAVRVTRPGPQRRFPQRPFLDTCPITAVPATTIMKDPTKSQHAISASALTSRAYEAAWPALQGLQEKYGPAVQKDLEKELDNAGWVAVVHADGNGLGTIISRLGKDELKAFSNALSEATEKAFADAINDVGGTNWIVPLILGGDDVTFVCDGRRAIEVTRAYLKRFELLTSQSAALSGPLAARNERPFLTACAGIAFVKPHFPFHAAFELAESLCGAAKKATKMLAPQRSSYDFHVVFDSVLRPLDEVRKQLTLGEHGEFKLWSAPFLAPSGGNSTVAPTEWTNDHEDQHLFDDVAAVLDAEEDRTISGATLARIREALLKDSGMSMRRTLDRVAAATTEQSVVHFLHRTLPMKPDQTQGFSRFMATLAAADMRTGVLAGPRATAGDET